MGRLGKTDVDFPLIDHGTGDHENNQQYQKDVHQRSDVDAGNDFFIVVSGYCHIIPPDGKMWHEDCGPESALEFPVPAPESSCCDFAGCCKTPRREWQR